MGWEVEESLVTWYAWCDVVWGSGGRERTEREVKDVGVRAGWLGGREGG